MKNSTIDKNDLDALLKATKAILTMKDFQSCAREIFNSCCEVTQATSGYVALLSDSGEENEVLFLEAGGRPCTVNPALPMPIRGLRAEAYHSCQTVYDNDFSNSKWMKFMPEGHVDLDNVLFAPLNIEGKTVGIMGLANKPAGFDEHDARMASTFGEFAAIALQNSRYLEKIAESYENQLQLEKQLQHAVKMQAIGTLSASVAHEFNNPLAGITNIIQGIKRRATYDENDAKLIDMAIDECARIKNLIRTLQDFNRPSSGKLAPMDIHTSIDSILLLITHEFESKNIDLGKEYAAAMPNILAVSDQIKQVILNLLNNAIYACSSGGKITINTDVSDGYVTIKIQDNGKGIAPGFLDKIFDPFFTTKPEVKGTGLGLSVSYGIIKNHGGRIDVQSELDKGSIFTITLPVKGPEDFKEQ